MVLSSFSQLIFDAKKLVVFRNTVRTRRSTCFDLSCVCCHSDVSDCAVFSFTRTVRDNSCVACAFRHFDRIECFSQCTDLVYFDQDRVAYAVFNTFRKFFRVCNEEVVTNKLNFFAKTLSKKLALQQSS